MKPLRAKLPWLRWLLVLLREQILIYYFGAGNFADTFNVALQVPKAAGELISRGKTGRKMSWGAAVALIGILLVPLWMQLAASGFKLVPFKFHFTIQLAEILLLTVPVLAEGALTSVLFHGVSAVSALFFAGFLLPAHPQWGVRPIVGIALGWVAGAVAFAFLKLTKKEPAKEAQSDLGPWAIPVILALSVLLGSSEGPGAASWLSYGFRLMEIGGGLLWVALAGIWVSDSTELALEKNVRSVFSRFLPGTVAMACLSIQWVRLLFQYGRFYPEDASRTASVLLVDCFTLLAIAFVRALSPHVRKPGLQGVWGPMASGWFSVALFTVFGALSGASVPAWGLALAAAVAAWIQVLGLALQIRSREFKPFSGSSFWRFAALELGFVVVIGAICGWSAHFLDGVWSESMWTSALGNGAFANATVPIFRALKLGAVLGEGWILLKFLKNKLTRSSALS